jgi:FkbM family methyltransferase
MLATFLSRQSLGRLPFLRSAENRRRAVLAVRAVRRLRRRAFERIGSARFSRPGEALEARISPYLDFDGGVFVEAGANDGFRQSNTYYLERFRGWSGLLVEPIPSLFRQCAGERPGAVVRNCALVSGEAETPSVVVRYADLGSTAVGVEDYPFDEVNFGWDTTYDVEVPARTLSSLLEEVGIGEVDFLSLDVEGFEVEALEGLDLSRHAPAYVLVEFWTEERLERIGALLGRGYELVERLTDHDAFFRRVDGHVPPADRAVRHTSAR